MYPPPQGPPPSADPVASPAPVPAVAFTCPRCRTPAIPSTRVQRCEQCGLRFTLVAGHAGDPTVYPSDPATHRRGFKVKLPGFFLMHQVELEPTGFCWGDLDPVVGVARMQNNRLAYPQTVSLAVWRHLNWPRLVANLLIGVPLTILFTIPALTGEPVMWVLAVPAALLTALGIYGAVGQQIQSMRIVSPTAEKELRLRRSGRRVRRFMHEALRRVSGDAGAEFP